MNTYDRIYNLLTESVSPAERRFRARKAIKKEKGMPDSTKITTSDPMHLLARLKKRPVKISGIEDKKT